jgi:glucose-fructose oxidoreductase
LGYYSRDLLGPAFSFTKHCHLAGIVTGSPEKIPIWQKKYGIPDQNVYNYQNMDQIATNDDIDVVYIVLPNGLHAEYTIKAAQAGKHVWCEKPMALNPMECEAMIDACKKNNRQLTIGYRMQHEPNTQTVIQFAKDKPYGAIQKIIAEAGFRGFNDKSHWKVRKELGGGAMYDMGVYSINASRYASQEEPIAVTARHEVDRPHIFDEVDETTHFTLEFPGGTKAECRTSFSNNWNHLKVDCKNGWYQLQPMQAYNGVKGETNDGILLNKPIENQQAKQMDDDALAILNDTTPLVTGEEGLKDIRILEAIYNSAAKGSQRIKLI